MEPTDVIVKPLVTEKGTHLQQTRNAYTFQVNPSATKPQIKSAVEKLYDVRVRDVRTMVRKGKRRRTRTGMTQRPDWKRAVVVLDENSKIELF
jgi:large subunit ribosomal protein L23